MKQNLKNSISGWFKKNKNILFLLKIIALCVSIILIVKEILSPFQALLGMAIILFGFYVLIKTLIDFKKTGNIFQALRSKTNLAFILFYLTASFSRSEKSHEKFIDQDDTFSILRTFESRLRPILNSEKTFIKINKFLTQKGDKKKSLLRIPDGKKPNLSIELNDTSVNIYIDKTNTLGEKFTTIPQEICALNNLAFSRNKCFSKNCNTINSTIKNLCRGTPTSNDIAQAEIFELNMPKRQETNSPKNSGAIKFLNNLTIETSYDCLIAYIGHLYQSEIESTDEENILINVAESTKLKSIIMSTSDKKIIAIDGSREQFRESICYINLCKGYIFAQRIEL